MFIKYKISWFLIASLIIVLSSACSHVTKYAPMGKSGGYTDKKISDRLYVVNVSTNAHTSMQMAEKYLVLRAGELCKESGYDYWEVLDPENRTQQTTTRVTETSTTPSVTNTRMRGSGTANTSYGYNSANTQANVYGNARSVQTGGESNTNTYDVKNVFPNIAAFVFCFPKSQRATLNALSKGISSSEAERFGVTDHLGAMQVAVIPPGVNSELDTGDLILRVDGKRITSMWQYLAAIENKQSVNLEILRNGQLKSINATTDSKKTTYGPDNYRSLASDIK